MAFKMKYRKGMGFPFKNDDKKEFVNKDEKNNDKEEFVNTGENQPGVTSGLHNALTEDLEFLKEQGYEVPVKEEDIK